MKNLYYIFILIPFIFTTTSCKKKSDPVIPNEQEVITTLIFKLVPDSGDTATFTFNDPDGEGGNDPVLTYDTLMANTSYKASLTLLNKSVSPEVNITDEIKDEDRDHQFFFDGADPLNLSVNYQDKDENGHPVGLETMVTTGDPSSGTLTITLRHKPDKSASGVPEGNILNAGGETDIEVTFNVQIK